MATFWRLRGAEREDVGMVVRANASGLDRTEMDLEVAPSREIRHEEGTKERCVVGQIPGVAIGAR